jgi:dTDP-4-amino-4,6-dideoxygalactose transaminase
MDQDYLRSQYVKVDKFEKALATYTGSPYVVCVDSCSSALLLCLLYNNSEYVVLPKNTYVGVAQAAINASKKIVFKDVSWKGLYNIAPTNIYDAAKRFTSNMYITGSNMCLSFHYKKHLNIGKGGAILTDNYDTYLWLRKARNNGKDIELPLPQQTYTQRGFNMVMHPLLAQKGLRILKRLNTNYGDLSLQMSCLNC